MHAFLLPQWFAILVFCPSTDFGKCVSQPISTISHFHGFLFFVFFWISRFDRFRFWLELWNSHNCESMVSGGCYDFCFSWNSMFGRFSDFAFCCTCDLVTGPSFLHPKSQAAPVEEFKTAATRSDWIEPRCSRERVSAFVFWGSAVPVSKPLQRVPLTQVRATQISCRRTKAQS